MPALAYITTLSIILLMGILCSVISDRFKISNMAILIIAGILLRFVKYEGRPLIEFPSLFIAGISIVALAMVVFDGSSRFKFRELDSFSLKAFKLFLIYLFLNLFLLSPLICWIFKIDIFLAMICSVLMSQTAFEITSSLLKPSRNSVMPLLETESILNTPFVVLLPFFILDLKKNIGTSDIATRIISFSLPFLQQIVIGIGAGILVGLIIFKSMKRKYSERLSPIALITSALLTYILAENLGGNGVLAVTTLGLFFGNIYLKQKEMLKDFSHMVSSSLEILIFILIGIVIRFPIEIDFLLKVLLIYSTSLAIRYLAINASFSSRFNAKEKIFMTLVSPKGITIATLALTFSTYNIEGISTLLNVLLLSMLYSIAVSTLATKFESQFLNKSR